MDRDEDEIADQLNKAYEQTDKGSSRWRGMTYEEGVVAALEWSQGNRETGPMDEEGEEG